MSGIRHRFAPPAHCIGPALTGARQPGHFGEEVLLLRAGALRLAALL
jgi:hypothetical protein